MVGFIENFLSESVAKYYRWDYGYQIAGMANRTTLVDNNTWNNSHIALVGKAMSSNETAAYSIMTELDVDYVLVIFGGVIGYSGDDINKFLWMVRIAEGEHPNDIRESDYFTERGEFRVDSEGSPTLLNCLMYKLSYYRSVHSTDTDKCLLTIIFIDLESLRWTTEARPDMTEQEMLL